MFARQKSSISKKFGESENLSWCLTTIKLIHITNWMMVYTKSSLMLITMESCQNVTQTKWSWLCVCGGLVWFVSVGADVLLTWLRNVGYGTCKETITASWGGKSLQIREKIKLDSALIYKPIFWVFCFHMSHCCGMVSCTVTPNTLVLHLHNRQTNHRRWECYVNYFMDSYLVWALHYQSPHNQLHGCQQIGCSAPAPGWLQVVQDLCHRLPRPHALLQDDQCE